MRFGMCVSQGLRFWCSPAATRLSSSSTIQKSSALVSHRQRSNSVADARRLAAGVMLKVVEGKDPQRKKKAERGGSTFAAIGPGLR